MQLINSCFSKSVSVLKSLTVGTIYYLLFITSLTLITVSCTEKNKDSDPAEQKAVVLEKGLEVKFPKESPGLKNISVTAVKLQDAIVSVNAPARVVASITTAVTTKEKMIIFDSPDFTSLFSQYRQTKTNIGLYTKNLARVKEMYDNSGATIRDLNQAENDLNLAKTSLSEYEGRIRSAGFNPVELENYSANSVWLISDVPESQLQEVQKGEEVNVVFKAFPDKTLKGHVKSIGDNVDPITRSVKVRIMMNNYKGKLIPGLFAQVDFGDPIHSVISLPPSAVVTVDGKDYVFVETTEGEFSRKEVSIKESSSDKVIITRGLNNGDKVVTNGAMLLKGLSFGY